MALQEATTTKLKIVYGRDPTRQGFYWSDSEQKRTEVLSVKRHAPSEFEAIYQGHPGERIGSIFLADDIDVWYEPPLGLLAGAGIESAQIALFCQQGHGVFQAWDTAFSTTYGSAYTVCVTGMFVPCQSYHRGEDPAVWGPCDFHFDVILLDLFRQKLDWGDLNQHFRAQYMKWRPHQILIEKKASGISLIQAWKHSDFPIVVALADGTSKKARAINSVTLESAGSVQGWFRQHRISHPLDAEWTPAWRTELMDFSGDGDSSNDQVDATVHLVTHAIRMGSGMAVLPTGWDPSQSAIPIRARDNTIIDPDYVDPRVGILIAISELPDLVEDPYYGTCARCDKKGSKQVCPITHRLMLPHDSCPEYDDSSGATVNLVGPQ